MASEEPLITEIAQCGCLGCITLPAQVCLPENSSVLRIYFLHPNDY